MEKDIELLWLPVARVALITGKSVKTIRRMIEEGTYFVLKRTVASGKTHTTKSFISVGQELIDLDKQYCRKHGQTPVYLTREKLTALETERNSLFIVSYDKVNKPEVDHVV